MSTQYLFCQFTNSSIQEPIFIMPLNKKSRILHECSCFIELIKRVEEKRYNARLAEHFISFSQRV